MDQGYDEEPLAGSQMVNLILACMITKLEKIRKENNMLVSDLYKVIDDDVKYHITFNNGLLHESVKGDDWNAIPEHVLEWSVRRMFVGFSGTIFIYCR